MTAANPTTWYFREGGLVTSTASDVADPALMLRANAYAKAVRGEALTDDERAAVAAGKGQPLIGNVSGKLTDDVALGYMFMEAPGLVQQLDDLIRGWADRLGFSDWLAWQIAADYTQRALAVTMDEAGLNADAETHLTRLASAGVTPDRLAEIRAELEEPEAMDTEEGALTPDGGPEGWSTVPPQ